MTTGTKSDTGVYMITLEASLTSFPSATATTTTFQVTILDGCAQTTLSAPNATNMVYVVGDSTPTT